MSQAGRRILVFSPHPDDDVLACGGTIIRKIREGHDVRVVYVTDGRNSHNSCFGIRENPTPEELSQLRRQEAIASAGELGLTPDKLIFLGFHNGTLRPGTHAAIDRITELLEELRPDEIYRPLRMDTHPEHRATGKIVLVALSRTKLQVVHRGYLVWHPPEKPKDWPAMVREPIAEFVEQKRRAIEHHRSQLTLMFPKQPEAVVDAELLAHCLRPFEEFVEYAPGVDVMNNPPDALGKRRAIF